MAETIEEMRQVCQQRRPNSKGRMVWAGHWFNRFFSRYISIYITWLFLKLGITANAVTFLMIPTTLIGVVLCVPHILWLNILGCSLVIMAEVLDCVDGELARWTKKSSIKGLYLDLVSHVLCNAPVSAICGLHMYARTRRLKYMVLAFVAYATVEILLGLRDVYLAAIWESMSSEEQTAKSLLFGVGQANKSGGRWSVNLLKRVLHILTDHVVVRLISVVCILVSHAGFFVALAFFAWLFPVVGIIVVVGDIANKYFFLVPNLEHTKVTSC